METKTHTVNSTVFTRFWKKFRLPIVLLLIVLGLIFGVRSIKHYNVVQKELTNFTSPDGSFALTHPKNWTVQNPGKGAIVATLMTDAVPSSSTMKPYINIAKGPSVGSLEDQYKETVFRYKKLFRNMKIISETTEKMGGEPARVIVLDASLGGKQMHYAVVETTHKDQIYTMTAAASPADGALLDEQLKNIMKSWKFTK
jgi:hypothetical protein